MADDTRALLLELGTEELPARHLPILASGLHDALVHALGEARLQHGATAALASPRRLAVQVQALIAERPGRESLRRGPVAAPDSQAAQGFARACGVPLQALETTDDNGKARLACRVREAAKPTSALLPAIVSQALKRLPIPRPMRWGDGEASFARPVRWLVLLFGTESIPITLYGVTSTSHTYGHRCHCPRAITLQHPDDYLPRLQDPGRVLADPAQRKQRIRTLLQQAADGADLGEHEALLDEVNALVEWPAAITGGFPEQYLQLPREVLLAVIRKQQRFFPLFAPNTGALLPRFICIANLESPDPDAIRDGNERVIRPRLADAEFFLNRDRQRPLQQPLDGLQFHERLGSMQDKTERIVQLCTWLAGQLDLPPAELCRAAALCKCDLLSELVGEFPELQGIVGGHLARYAKEPGANAIAEHYQPTHATAPIPTTPAGQALALADRLDTLAGLFSVGAEPTSEKDPYGLRRAALGCMRILIEGNLPLNLQEALQQTAAPPTLLPFMYERLRAWYQESGITPDLYEAVAAHNLPTPLDFHQRIQALQHFRTLPEAAQLTTIGKRIRNILRKQPAPPPLQPEQLQEEAEQALATHLHELQPPQDYIQQLEQLATLHAPLDRFFVDVMVLCEDATLRNNRLALLHQINQQLNRVADLSKLN